MTRINLVSPKELTDQHLMREYQELPRIVGLVRKAIHKGRKPSDFKIASDYILGSGHVTFFYNKLEFLRKRQLSLIAELLVREYKIVHQEGLDLYDIPNEWKGDYIPTNNGLILSRERIREKILMKPQWYKYKGHSIDISQYIK
ncbi:pyrimidine dimer DNA glycosylase/endonuclease V [Shigella flexneri]